MISLRGRRSTALIGVDISASSIKLVELKPLDDGRYRLERYVIESLPREAVADGNIVQLEVVTDCLKRAWRHLHTRTGRVAMALPAAAVITKKIVVPAGLSEHELEMQVEAEASQYIPFALDEVNLDFQVLGATAGAADDIDVLIAAAKKEKVEDRVAVAEGAGLEALIMDVESYATQAAVELSLPPPPPDLPVVAVVDVGATMTHVNVLHAGHSVYIREQGFGGDHLTQEIQRRYGMSPEEAELSKRNGSLPEGYESEVLEPFLETLALETARALQFFFSSTHFSHIDHLLLAGGCALLPGLEARIAARTGIATAVANPFARMVLSSFIKPKQLAQDAPSLLIACGLALRNYP